MRSLFRLSLRSTAWLIRRKDAETVPDDRKPRSMKEDILEQLVEDWLQAQGYFTRANLRFKPPKTRQDLKAREDSVPSDIDGIGLRPAKTGAERVLVVGCKACQGGRSDRARFVCQSARSGKTSNRRKDYQVRDWDVILFRFNV